MKREQRLTRREDFRRVYRNGSIKFGRYLVVHLLPVTDDSTKVGISVSKKVGNAVVRNRVKRRLREIVRLNWEQLPERHYVVFGAKAKSRYASHQQLQADFHQLLKV